jgi:hypothetical protein
MAAGFDAFVRGSADVPLTMAGAGRRAGIRWVAGCVARGGRKSAMTQRVPGRGPEGTPGWHPESVRHFATLKKNLLFGERTVTCACRGTNTHLKLRQFPHRLPKCAGLVEAYWLTSLTTQTTNWKGETNVH